MTEITCHPGHPIDVFPGNTSVTFFVGRSGVSAEIEEVYAGTAGSPQRLDQPVCARASRWLELCARSDQTTITQ